MPFVRAVEAAKQSDDTVRHGEGKEGGTCVCIGGKPNLGCFNLCMMMRTKSIEKATQHCHYQHTHKINFLFRVSEPTHLFLLLTRAGYYLCKVD